MHVTTSDPSYQDKYLDWPKKVSGDCNYQELEKETTIENDNMKEKNNIKHNNGVMINFHTSLNRRFHKVRSNHKVWNLRFGFISSKPKSNSSNLDPCLLKSLHK